MRSSYWYECAAIPHGSRSEAMGCVLGDQLYSQSSEDAVSKLLAEGVRHLELDLWDGCDGEPECYHGYTSTSKVKLVALLHAINEAAFQTSIYPG